MAAGDGSQPHDSRLGAVPPARQVSTAHLQPASIVPSSRHSGSWALEEASSQRANAGSRDGISRSRGGRCVVLLRLQARSSRSEPTGSRVAVSCDFPCRFPAYTSRSRRAANPCHPGMGDVLRSARTAGTWPSTLAGPGGAALPVANTRRGKCACVWSTTDLSGDGMAQPSRRPQGAGRARRRNQPPASAPGVPSSTAQHVSAHRRCVSQEAFGRLEPCELETLTHGS